MWTELPNLSLVNPKGAVLLKNIKLNGVADFFRYNLISSSEISIEFSENKISWFWECLEKKEYCLRFGSVEDMKFAADLKTIVSHTNKHRKIAKTYIHNIQIYGKFSGFQVNFSHR